MQFESSTSLQAYLRHLATCIFLARGVGNLMQRSGVYHSVSCTIILSVVYYPVSCALLGHLCNLSVSCMLQVAVGSWRTRSKLKWVFQNQKFSRKRSILQDRKSILRQKMKILDGKHTICWGHSLLTH